MNKAEARTRVMQFMDAVGNDRWDTSPNGEVDRTIGLMQLREWRRILEQNPFYRMAVRTPAVSPTGTVEVSALSAGSGDAVQSLYRILSVEVGNILYQQLAFTDVPRAARQGAFAYGWYQAGDQIQLLPASNMEPATITVNHLPTPQYQTAGEGSDFIFVPGYEDVPLMEAAAFLLAKGGAETNATVELRGLAEQLRMDLLLATSRLGLTGRSIRFVDAGSEWGA